MKTSDPLSFYQLCWNYRNIKFILKLMSNHIYIPKIKRLPTNKEEAVFVKRLIVKQILFTNGSK